MEFRDKETWLQYKEAWEEHKKHLQEGRVEFTQENCVKTLDLLLNYKVGYDKYIPYELSEGIEIIDTPILDVGEDWNELGYGVDEKKLINIVTGEELLDFSYEIGDCGGYLNWLYIGGVDYSEEFKDYYSQVYNYVEKIIKEIYKAAPKRKIILYRYNINLYGSDGGNFKLDGFNSIRVDNYRDARKFVNWMYLDEFKNKVLLPFAKAKSKKEEF